MVKSIDPLSVMLKMGLVLVCVGWAFGSWWICCSGDTSHHFHEVYLRRRFQEYTKEEEASNGLMKEAVGNNVPMIQNGAIHQAREDAQPKGGQHRESDITDVTQRSKSDQPIKIIHGTKHLANQMRAGLRTGSATTDAPGAAQGEIVGPDGDDPASSSREAYYDVDGTLVTRGTIFLVLAAYREQRGSRTIAHAFEMATRPDDLFVGIFQQRDPAKDPQATNFSAYCSGKNPSHPVCSRTRQIQSTEIDWKEGEGPCVARARAEQMLGNQEFVFQIDSHSTFVKGWDDILLKMWRSTKNEFAVLSAYPRSEGEMSHSGEFKQLPMICSANMLDWSVRDMLKNNPGYQMMQPTPVRTMYFGAGLVFSKSHRVRRVPYDLYLRYLFDGEEFDMAMRLFTHGYDIYAPNDTAIYHFYSSPEYNHKHGILKFWDYKWGQRFPIMFRSTRRLRHKIGIQAVKDQDPKIDETDLTDLDHYAVGDRRTVQQFLDAAGVDLIGKKVTGCCHATRQQGGIDHVLWNDASVDPVLNPGLYAAYV